MVGTTLLHYRILGPIGKGGMGEVYAAEDLKLSRRVALKVLPTALADNPDRRRRFEREAKVVAALNHPNIVTIYSIEEAQGIHFLTMELVQGKTLYELVSGQAMRLDRLLPLAVAVADAVGAAHRQGIVHRDLKPQNIVVDEGGRPKVLDFGLAKLRAESGTNDRGTQLPTEAETREGRILGTVYYMSPEQAEGKPVDARSDIFSLGVILYEMITGRLPFRGDTPISTISSILRDKPESILDRDRTLPRHLARIVNRCLAKDPDRRYQTAVDLRNDLEGLEEEIRSGEIVDEGEIQARPRRASGHWALAAVGFICAALVLYGIDRVSRDRRAPVPSSFEGMKITRLTTTGRADEAAISADGKYVVYVETGAGGHSLWLRQVSTPSSVQIVPPTDADIFDPTFSPDGDAIYYLRNERDANDPTLYRVPVLGGPSIRTLATVSERISFSPDRSRFVFLRFGVAETLIMVADRNGDNPRAIAARKLPDEYVGETAWSPDGSVIAVAAVRWTGRMDHSVIVVPSGGGEERTVSRRTWGEIGEIAWLPDGSGLVVEAREATFGSTQLWEVSYPEGRTRRITNDLNAYHGVGLTADGDSLVTVLVERESHVWITPGADPTNAARVTSGTKRADGQVSWAPDGRIVHTSNVSGNIDLWITDADGAASSQLTFEDGVDYDPSVCPDGRYVVFVSDRAGSHNLWRIDLNGGNAIRLTTGEGEFHPRCHGDGRRVLFIAQGPHLLGISEVPIEGGQTVALTPPETSASWFGLDVSHDGSHAAYAVWDELSRQWFLETRRLADGHTRTHRVPIPIGYPFRWAPDGSISYVEEGSEASNLWSRTLDGGPAKRVTAFDEGEIVDFAWSPDGSRLALSRGRETSDIVLLRSFR
jgi:Tol biopolymer transport system component